MYLLEVKPYEDPFQNKLEVFNELFVLLSTYLILLFSPFLDNMNIKYNIGWVLVGIVCLNMVINMLIMLYRTFRMVKMSLIKTF